MTKQEQLKRTYQKKVIKITILVVTALLLVVALIANVARLVSANRRIARLEAEIAMLDDMIDRNGDELEYRKTPEYIERFAREYLQMVNPGESAFR